MDRGQIELRVFRAGTKTAEGIFYLSEDDVLCNLRLEVAGSKLALADGLRAGKVRWRVCDQWFVVMASVVPLSCERVKS
jgi:hypothetical protein